MPRKAKFISSEPVSSDPVAATLEAINLPIEKAPEMRTQPSRWRYRVLKPIHHARGVPGVVGQDLQGQVRIMDGRIDDERAYYPAEMSVDGKTITTTMAMIPGCLNGRVASGGHGRPIPVDVTGEILLTEEEVMAFRVGQVEPIDSDAPEVPSGLIDIIAQDEVMMARLNLEGKSPEDANLDLMRRVAELERHQAAVRGEGIHF